MQFSDKEKLDKNRSITLKKAVWAFVEISKAKLTFSCCLDRYRRAAAAAAQRVIIQSSFRLRKQLEMKLQLCCGHSYITNTHNMGRQLGQNPFSSACTIELRDYADQKQDRNQLQEETQK